MVLRRLWLPAAAVVCAAACGDLLAEPGPSPPDDAGVAEAGVDATTSDVVARPPTCGERFDAGPDGGALIFCDDFERETADGAGWLPAYVANGGTLSTSSTHARSGTRSLLAEVPGGQNPQNKVALLTTRLLDTGVFPVVIEFEMLAELLPSYAGMPYNGLVFGSYPVSFDAAAEPLLLYAGVSDAGAYNPYLTQADEVITIPVGAWRHFALTIERDLTTLTISTDGEKDVTRVRLFDLDQPPRKFSLGVDVGLDGGPARLFIDDVVVHH